MYDELFYVVDETDVIFVGTTGEIEEHFDNMITIDREISGYEILLESELPEIFGHIPRVAVAID